MDKNALQFCLTDILANSIFNINTFINPFVVLAYDGNMVVACVEMSPHSKKGDGLNLMELCDLSLWSLYIIPAPVHIF